MMDKLIVIAGPTACGKSALAVGLAQRLNGEIVSADSMQVYKYMDIGTSKITAREMGGVRHYLIDEVFPDEEFSVALFQEKARIYINDIISRGKIPILAGGTGFYINAVLYGTDFKEAIGERVYREKLYELAAEKGSDYIHGLLGDVDPDAAAAIHPNNLKRAIRALEFYDQTKTRISEHNLIERNRRMVYNAKVIILCMERRLLWDRIDRRADSMIKLGLVDEVRALLDRGYGRKLTSMQGIGYKEMIRYLYGESTFEDAVAEIKKGTKHYAKRQGTWFRNRTAGHFINISDNGAKICDVTDYIKREWEM